MRNGRRCRGLVAVGALAAWVVAAHGAPVPSRSLPTYVLLGIDTINMKEFAFTNVGNVGVNDKGGTMSWGKSSVFANNTEVVTDILQRAGQKSSMYDLFANTIVSPLAQAGAIVRHDGPVSWSPLPLISALPPTPSCTAGSTTVAVPKNGSQTLAPGSYGKVVVPNGATLDLTGGTYCFANFKTGRKATITVSAPSDITVLGKFTTNTGTKLLPGPGVGASDIHVGVAGSLVKLSHKNHVAGIFYAPNGQLRFGHGGFYIGQFVAKVLRSDFGDTFTLEDCGNGIVDTGEQCDDGPNGSACCTPTCDFRPAGTPCPDGDLCNGNEVCSAAGQCVPGTPPDCRDSRPCRVGSCDPVAGCVSNPVPDQTPCPDGNVCNGAEVCIGGTCTSQPGLNCNDNNPCTTDSCDAINGCKNTPVQSPIPGCQCPNGDSDCDNHNVCDGKETCDPSHQFCHPGTPLSCGTTNQCLVPSCDQTNGCTTTPQPPGTPCNDNDACTTNDQCVDSTCGGFPLSCDDGNPCTADACDSQSGCSNTPIPGCGTGSTTLCTLTQGAYGSAGNGIGNGPQGWITNNPGVFPATIGALGTASVTINTQAGLIAFMPTNGGPNELNPANGDVVINVAGDVPDPHGTGSNGDGAGTLAGQTLAMTLSVALSNSGANPPGLGGFGLGSSCTCVGNGPPSSPFTFSSCILNNATTVNDLLSLANHALGGEPLGMIDPCLTYSDIDSALDTLNNGFDECKSVCNCGP